jgi:hypothetical protein
MLHTVTNLIIIKTYTVKTGQEWLGYRNGHVVVVFKHRYAAESWLQARKVDSTAPVAQHGTPESWIGTIVNFTKTVK